MKNIFKDGSYFLLSVVAGLFPVMVWWLCLPSPMQVWPDATLSYRVETADHLELNNPLVDPQLQVLSWSEKGLIYSYRLMDALQPLAQVTIFRKDGETFDWSSQDEIDVQIHSSRAKRIPLTVVVRDKKYTFRPLVSLIDVHPQQQSVKIRLKDFQTPRSWYSENQLTEDQVEAADFSAVLSFGFGNEMLYESNSKKSWKDVVTVSKLVIGPDKTTFYFFALIWVMGCIFGAFVYRYFLQKKKVLQMPYQNVKAKNREDEEWEQLVMVIAKKYTEPELNLENIQRSTGLHERRISTLVRKKTGLTFKQYLNQRRLEEAKKLLTRPELSIAEVAFRSGYGSIAHFNKVFKAVEGLSPGDFRKNL